MDEILLWVIGILFFLFLFYLLIASIVNKIKEPAEAEAQLIDLKKEKGNYLKLSKEAEQKAAEAEKTIKEAESKYHAACVEENRYLALKEDLIKRYNNAVSKIDTDTHRKALEMLSYSNDFLLAFVPQCDIAELHQSIIEGKLLRAFESPPEISNVKVSALIKSPNGFYTTTLGNCTCKDFQFRKHPCKHMLYLYYILGMLKIDQPITDDAISKLHLITVDISKKETELKKLNDEKICLDSYIKAQEQKKASISHEIEQFNEILKDKYSQFPRVAEIISQATTRHYDNAVHRLILKKNPAHKAADAVKILSKETKIYVKELTELRLKLAYIEDLFPNINDIFEPGFNNEDSFELETKENTDRVRLFLTPEEYASLSTTEKNQLALDRYIEQRKSKWQIGRDYEMYVGHKLENEGYKVQYTGIVENLEDMGRDLIATQGNKTLVVQCKNWSQEKTIHEKHIFQLYGTIILYKLDNPLFDVKGVFVTTTVLSEKAKAVAKELEIEVIEHFSLGDFPRIKCNINRTSGEKIYHLPFDQQYDTTVINKNDGEMYAFTVKEAEDLGFRRAWRHFS